MIEPRLSKEQLEKLEKLENELKNKRDYDESSRARRLATAKRTGIPYDIVDTDVIKIGMMLGIIKSLDKRDDPNNGGMSLLDIFLDMGSASQPYQYANIPSYFELSPERYTESERIDYQRELVKRECDVYCSYITNVLVGKLSDIEKVVALPIQHITPESFIHNVTDTMNVVMEMLVDSDDENEECWKQLVVLRNSLLCVMPICEYKQVVVDQITQLRELYPLSKILESGMTRVDGMLTLFPGFETKTGDSSGDISTALIVRSHTRDPELKPFDMTTIVKECLTPAIAFVPLADVLVNCVIGPYNNNSVGYMKSQFYLMKSIVDEVRMWVIDVDLIAFSRALGDEMLKYAVKLARNMQKAGFCPEILTTNISHMSDPIALRHAICSIVAERSVIIPSDADVFDNIVEHSNM